jgi:hypothetical protein
VESLALPSQAMAVVVAQPSPMPVSMLMYPAI